MPTLPPFLETQRLRDLTAAADTYKAATGDSTMSEALHRALDFAEKLEDPNSYSFCPVCKDRIPRWAKYCGWDCMEEAGVIEK